MNLLNLFRITAALFIFTGLMWLVAPKAMPASLGLDIDPYGAYYLQQLGATNVALGVLFFLVSRMAHSAAGQVVVTFMIVLQVLSLGVSLLAMLGGAIPAGAGWFSVALNLVFALAFGYFGFIRPETSLTPERQS